MIPFVIAATIAPGIYQVQAEPGADVAPVITRVLEHCHRRYPDRRQGCEVRLPRGRFAWNQAIQLREATSLTGAGGHGRSVLTVLSVPCGVSPIEILPGGATSVLSHLGFEGRLKCTEESFGIDARGNFVGRHLWIRGFTHGIHLHADCKPGTPREGNANLWSLSNVWLEQNAHAGLWTQGDCANAGNGVALNVSSNCAYASRWNENYKPDASICEVATKRSYWYPFCHDRDYQCGNVYLSDFLGNTFTGLHTASAGDLFDLEARRGRLRPKRYPNIIARGLNARHTLLGTYCEGDGLPSYHGPQTTVLGGLCEWHGQGFELEGQVANGLRVKNTQGTPEQWTEVRLGGASTDPRSAFELFRSPVDKAPLRMKGEVGPGGWRWCPTDLKR